MEIALTVTDLVGQIKDLLEGEFRHVMVEGEITNLSSSSSGHWYFSISDKDSGLSCALFKMDALRNPIIKKLRDGDKVCCHGRIGVYQKRGTFQLIVENLLPIGKGDLKEQFELLKKRLAGEGLFDLTHKMKIPSLPKRVAVITAEQGAALQDFLNVFKRRSLWMDVMIVPALVQGEGAPASLVQALNQILTYHNAASEDKKIDIVVLTRGGGSLEDLWAFNDEKLARTIFSYPIPTVSAIGHQVDYTICDFVADLRAETPTAAAEQLTEAQMRLRQKIGHLKGTLENRMSFMVSEKARRLSRLQPRAILDGLWRLQHERSQRLDDALMRVQRLTEEKILKTKLHLEKKAELLHVLNPRHVLNRGFCFLRSPEGEVLESKEQFDKIPTEKVFTIEFVDGSGRAKRVEKS